jgi:membrane peptidoglycan carboxypeptidase
VWGITVVTVAKKVASTPIGATDLPPTGSGSWNEVPPGGFSAGQHPLEALGRRPHAPSLIGAIVGFIVFSVVAGILCTVAITPGLAVAGLTASQSVGIFQDLPGSVDIGNLPQRNRIFANGPAGPVQIATVYDQNREEDSWGQISQYLKDAAIDGEDKDFYSHGGVDFTALVRAAASNVNAGSVTSGASTIAMQVVRNIQTEDALQLKTAAARKAAYNAATEDTLPRKLKEMRLAIGIEKQFSKQEILNEYLNIANFGGNNYGVEAAAQTYFSTTALKVTPAEAASIIAIVQDPSTRSLGTKANYAANETRRNFILSRMYAANDITKAQYETARSTPVDAAFVKPSVAQNGCLAAAVAYRWICDYTVNDVDNLTALGANKTAREASWATGGYDIYTTFDTQLQDAATSIISSLVPAGETRFNLGGALSTVQPGTGKILVMAENKTYDDTLTGGGSTTTAVNYNVDRDNGGSSGFQPGSAYKLFTLLDWLEQGHKLTDVFNASVRSMPMTSFTACGQKLGGPAYTFKNDENEGGSTTILQATARSINSVFIQMASKLDLCDIRDIASSLGVHNATGQPLSDLPSCIIGGCSNTIAPLTLATAYAAIADQGVLCSAVAVEKIVDADGKDLGAQSASCHQAIPANIANTAAKALQGVMTGGGTGVSANPNDGTAFMGKTGTTNDSLETWIVASSTKASTAVWIGNISGSQQLRKISVGGTQAALLRHKVFKGVMKIVDAYLGPAPAFAAADPALVGGGKYVGSPTGATGVKPVTPAAPPVVPVVPVVPPTPPG